VTRPRNVPLEVELVDLAARAAGYPSDAGLSRFADARAWPGGVNPRTPDGWRQEVAEELADARNYLLWEIEEVYEQVLAGGGDACTVYERNMRVLTAVLAAWWALLGDTA
jgi:hypothetical protein